MFNLSLLYQQLRTVLEVAVVAFISTIIGPVFMIGFPLIFDFVSMPGVGPLSLTFFGSLALLAPPFAGGYWYGLKRRRQLAFVSVLIGWGLGWVAYSVAVPAAIRALAGTSVGPQPKAPVHPMSPWIALPLWFLMLGVFAILPTLVTMYGQKRRMARTMS